MIITTRLIPQGFYALTIWPFVLVRHERKHLEQIERDGRCDIGTT